MMRSQLIYRRSPARSPLRQVLGPSDLPTVFGVRGIVVLAPHPDDEVLGCGALIAAMQDYDVPVFVIYLTDGGASVPGLSEPERQHLVQLRQAEALQGLKTLGLLQSQASFIGAPDGALKYSLKHISLATAKLHALIRRGLVSSVLVTSEQDNHPDHKAAHQLAQATVQAWPRVKLFTYPVSSRIDRVESNEPPLELTQKFPIAFHGPDYLAKKRAALACHQSQLGLHAAASGFTLSQDQIALVCEGPEYFASTEIKDYD
jgi:LmbE family N-acetylglucosaminyl deacetylase